MKIAVCDDSREDRSELRELLEACGYDFEIREYGSGVDRESLPDGVVLHFRFLDGMVLEIETEE